MRGKICQYLHTNHYEQDSSETTDRVKQSFIQGWRACEEHGKGVTLTDSQLAVALVAVATYQGAILGTTTREKWEHEKLEQIIGLLEIEKNRREG